MTAGASRERDIVDAFLAAGDHADELDVVEMVTMVSAQCAELVHAQAVGMFINDESGKDVLQFVAASNEDAKHLAVFEAQVDQGPCLEAYSSGKAVLAGTLEEIEQRYPNLAAGVKLAGFQSMSSIPVQAAGKRFGAIGMFSTTPGVASEADQYLVRALGVVAASSILRDRDRQARSVEVENLQKALTSRVVLDQAKGLIAGVGGVTVEVASEQLRSYARRHHLKMVTVANRLLHRSLTAQAVLVDHDLSLDAG